MPYNVLALDGGGSWALIEVEALIDLYGTDAKGRAVLGDCDLVAANSGGSIVLRGLGRKHKTLAEIRSLFLNEALAP